MSPLSTTLAPLRARIAHPKSLTRVAGASGCGLLVWSLSNSTPLTTLTPGIPERIASTASGDTSCSRAIDQSKLSKNSTFCAFRLFVQTQKFQETTPNVMFVPSPLIERPASKDEPRLAVA
jgi:hypothetical protein